MAEEVKKKSKIFPNVIVIACNWCTYAAADLAGSLRCKYPTNSCIVRVPCSGRVEAEFIIEAFLNGADGVFIGGCHPGDCHYRYGNYFAERRFFMLKRFLELLGIDKERLRLEWISGSEGMKFAEEMNKFISTLEKMPPLTWNPGLEKDILFEIGRTIYAAASIGRPFFENTLCWAEVVKFLVEHLYKKSCAKCVPCRIGGKYIVKFVDKFTVNPEEDFPEKSKIEWIAWQMAHTARCNLGKVTGKVIEIFFKYFEEERRLHKEKGCAHNLPALKNWKDFVPAMNY